MKNNKVIRVVELFAGVGGFRIGLEAASPVFQTIWNNQWEPSTVKQDASLVYRARFGDEGHINTDINKIKTDDIPDHDLLVGGFPCQDYSVASTLSRSGGIEGKKGVLWWQIYRILLEKGEKCPNYIFLENVDRLLSSPAKQRGRDFAIILASLSDLGYTVEWRVINAAEYGMPQRRRRTYIVGYRNSTPISEEISDFKKWILYDGVMAKSFPVKIKAGGFSQFNIEGNLKSISDNFNKQGKTSPFLNAGIINNRKVYTVSTEAVYNGTYMTLGSCLIDDCFVPEEFFISDESLEKWKYEKSSKKIDRISKEGFKYTFSEGAMNFPDDLDKASRTIITGEGGVSPSRFKHIIYTHSKRYRRLTPLELERLNMFPDNHTLHSEVSDGKRAFLMGNALVCGIVREVGRSLYRFIYKEEPISLKPMEIERNSQPLLDLGLFDNSTSNLVVNKPIKKLNLDLTKALLIGLVKTDNENYFLDIQSEKIYYTGKTKSFPSTISLNKLYFFMPYIKGKGVRDLYLIRKARIGNKQEIYPSSNDKAPRLIFELEYLQSLDNYKPVKLNILRTYRDTILGAILSKNETLT